MVLPLKLAVVGGGPSAFYVVSRILQQLPQNSALGSRIRVHIFDKLWAPHGLVRYGIAPDHPEVKNCTSKFNETAHDPRVRFFGNVNIGAEPISTRPDVTHVPLSSLLPHYSHLLLANGCPTPRVHPALSLPSSVCRPALDIVHWYTSHPDSVSPPDLSRTEHVTIIGHGNVALDVARILLSHPSRLERYDVPNAVLDVLSKSRVKHVSILGRRGPLQASFAPRELREVMSLNDVAFEPLTQDVIHRTEAEVKEIESEPEPQIAGGETLGIGTGISRAQKRMFSMLKTGSKAKYGSTDKTFSIEFFKSPLGLEYITSGSRSVTLKLSHTKLDASGPSARALPTGDVSNVNTDLVLPSLGYLPDSSFFADELSAQWIATPSLSHVRNASGRIIDAEGKAVRNAYVSGWAANGAKGVLARTVEDSRLVSSTIVEDFLKGLTEDADARRPSLLNTSISVQPDSIPPEIQSGLERGTVTTYEDWEQIDAEEIRRGPSLEGDIKKERERMDWSSAKAFLWSRKLADGAAPV